jgi:hypothetical protein
MLVTVRLLQMRHTQTVFFISRSFRIYIRSRDLTRSNIVYPCASATMQKASDPAFHVNRRTLYLKLGRDVLFPTMFIGL